MKRLITDKQLKEKLGNRNVTPEDEADQAIATLIGM